MRSCNGQQASNANGGALRSCPSPGGVDARPFAHQEHLMAELHDGFEPRDRFCGLS